MQLKTVTQKLPSVSLFFGVMLTVQILSTSNPQEERMRCYIKVSASQILHQDECDVDGGIFFFLSPGFSWDYLCVFSNRILHFAFSS